jgi:hypothetical protein
VTVAEITRQHTEQPPAADPQAPAAEGTGQWPAARQPGTGAE